MEKLNRYFYSIEKDNNGNKIIHMSGELYWNDSDESKTDYRLDEYRWLYITINELKTLIEKNKFLEFMCEKVDCSCNATESEAKEFCNSYFDGNSGEKLSFENITENTPCGDYWC